MDLPEAIEIAVRAHNHPRYRELCDESWPDHEYWRRQVFRVAGHPLPEPEPGPEAPPLPVVAPARSPAPWPPAFPGCPDLGIIVESGEGCGCGPKRLCGRFTRIVAAADCLACPDRPGEPSRPYWETFTA